MGRGAHLVALLALALCGPAWAAPVRAAGREALDAENSPGQPNSGGSGGGRDGHAGAASPKLSHPNSTATDGKEPQETIAQILDEALHEEFKQEEQKQAGVGKQFNVTATSSEATQETVIIISKSKAAAANRTAEAAAAAAGNATDAEAGLAAGDDTSGAGAANATADAASLVGMDVEQDVDRIIDSKDNEYVLSKPNEQESMGLNLDPAFVRDITTLVGASSLAGLAMETLGQPTINGYFIAGSVIGPGGLNLVKELVQVQSMAQLGVQLLLFTLGLEFSVAKLRVVRNVALLGGLLQILACAALGGVAARLIGSIVYQGIFVGAVVSMSSTSIVIKVLNDTRSANTQHGQITIGTLILQDCMVGLLFAFMPVLSSSIGGPLHLGQLVEVLWRVLLKLAVLLVGAAVLARTVLPVLVRLLLQRYSGEVFQMALLGFCFVTSLLTQKQGISSEVGAFVAGVMLTATDQQEVMLHQLEPVSRFFLALFISSTGLVLSPRFLLHHLPVLAMGVMVVIIAKTCLVAVVVSLFGYPGNTALAVGMNMAQIGEFAFILLSVASELNLVANNVYMLLMGVTALSLLVTPLLLQLSTRVQPHVRAVSLALADVELAPAPLKRHSSGVDMEKSLQPPDPPLNDVVLKVGHGHGLEYRASRNVLQRNFSWEGGGGSPRGSAR